MIGDILVCKLKVKFVISLASLIKKKSAQPFKKIIFKKKKFGLFQWEMGLFFFLRGKNFLWWGLRPRSWAGPSS